MANVVKTGHAQHDAKVDTALKVAQAAITPSASQATVNAAEITYFKACAQSAAQFGLSPAPFIEGLRTLGVTSIY